MLKKGLEAKTWADISKPSVNIAVDAGSPMRPSHGVSRRNANIKVAEVAR